MHLVEWIDRVIRGLEHMRRPDVVLVIVAILLVGLFVFFLITSLIHLFFFPFHTRYLSPEDFGRIEIVRSITKTLWSLTFPVLLALILFRYYGKQQKPMGT